VTAVVVSTMEASATLVESLSRLTFAGTLTLRDVAVLTSASRNPLLLVELVLVESVVMTEASSPAMEETRLVALLKPVLSRLTLTV